MDNKYAHVMHLGNPTNTIAVLNRYGFNFQKKFGQNFLIDENVVEKIVREAGVTKDDFVLEVGPGIGTMTQILSLPLLWLSVSVHISVQAHQLVFQTASHIR